MRTKYLAIIFILFLLIALASGLVIFLTEEKGEPVVNEQAGAVEKRTEPAVTGPDEVAPTALEEVVKPEKTEAPKPVIAPTEEKIKVVMIISGVKYEAAVKLGGSVYDLMNILNQENKINFSGKNYSGLGFFMEEINGVKNNPAGANWLYYVNGQPAQTGVSNYELKNNDTIEWKYENKSF
ncbi:MAG: DUF4430 domain-containing protein [Patescibacteria group bacterium]|jgi:hypothetical protein